MPTGTLLRYEAQAGGQWARACGCVDQGKKVGPHDPQAAGLWSQCGRLHLARRRQRCVLCGKNEAVLSLRQQMCISRKMPHMNKSATPGQGKTRSQGSVAPRQAGKLASPHIRNGLMLQFGFVAHIWPQMPRSAKLRKEFASPSEQSVGVWKHALLLLLLAGKLPYY